MPFTCALAQLAASEDKDVNLEKAEAVFRMARGKAELVVFPEGFMTYPAAKARREVFLARAEPLDGPFATSMAHMARHYGCWTVFGMQEQGPLDRPYNTVVLLDDQGTIQASYRKTHLYDAFGWRESDLYTAGAGLTPPIATPFGRLGLLVCYELRFPELARTLALAGADILVVPTAWVEGPLKERHFQTLVSARALENTVFVLAVGLAGRPFIGQSLVVDPLGVPLASGPEDEALLFCTIDEARLVTARRLLPWPQQRRPECYELPSS